MTSDQPNGASPISIRFVIGDETYTGEASPNEIVHQVFERVLPQDRRVGHRLTFRTPGGDEVFADNFVRNLRQPDGNVSLITRSEPISGTAGDWKNYGIDHLALTVADRRGARDFFSTVLNMQVVRDDAHITVLATPMSALFLFDAGADAPMSDPEPSRFHHLGFVVDNLEAAFAHLHAHREMFSSDFALLERDERWSLYCHYRNGDTNLMIQLSEVKADEAGVAIGPEATARMYDYARRPYGLVFDETATG